MSESKVEVFEIGANVVAKTDGNMVWIGFDRTKDAGRSVTDKGNKTIATVGGRANFNGLFINFTAYKAAK
jgi:hypothetical protein